MNTVLKYLLIVVAYAAVVAGVAIIHRPSGLIVAGGIILVDFYTHRGK